MIWIEPIDKIFQQLIANLNDFPKQRAYKQLFSDEDDKTVRFNITNNNGLSSSMLDLAGHSEIWPEVVVVGVEQLVTRRFDTFVRMYNIDLTDFQAMVIDTQGTELAVLKGVGQYLSLFKFIKIEAADFEAYSGCCVVPDLIAYMESAGFHETRRAKFATAGNGGSYYDILFKNAIDHTT